jgi:hypothetical protein
MKEPIFTRQSLFFTSFVYSIMIGLWYAINRNPVVVAIVRTRFQSRRDDTLLTVGVAERILRQDASSIRQSALSIRQNASSIRGNTLPEWGNALSTRGNTLSERGNTSSEWENALSEGGDALFPWVNDSS